MKTVVAHITFADGETDAHQALLKDSNWAVTGKGEWRKRFVDEATADSEAGQMLKSLRGASPCSVSAKRSTLSVTEG